MIYAKLAAAAAIFIAGCTVTSWYYGKQIATMQKEAAEATTKAVQEAMDKTQADQKRKDEAINEATLRAKKFKDLANALDRDIDSVRDERDSARAALSKASIEAVRNYANTARDVYGACVQRYSAVAKEADQCTSDLRMTLEAWPD